MSKNISYNARTFEDYKEQLKLFTQKYGIVTDPTYVGKALHGLLSMINNGEIEKGSKVLFWHTGGLINLFEQTEKII